MDDDNRGVVRQVNRPMQTDIAQVSTVHPPFDTRIFQKICLSLVARGWSVGLVVCHPKDEVIEGVRIHSLRRPKNRFFRVTLAGFSATRKAMSLKPKVYHFHDPELLPFAWFLRLMRKNVIYDMHENVPAALRRKEWMVRPVRVFISKAWAQLERVFLSRSTVVMAETSYRGEYPWIENSTVLRNFPKLNTMRGLASRQKHQTKTLVYVGHVHPSRGSFEMLKAAGELRQRGLDVLVKFVGYVPAKLEPELKAKAECLGVNLRMTGALPPLEAWAEVSASHIGLACLAAEPNYISSYPTKMFEYMALGLPVVVSDFPLYKEVVDNARCGFAVDPEDAVAIANACESILRDDAMAHRMGDSGKRAAACHYSWEAEQEKLYAIYDAILRQPQ